MLPIITFRTTTGGEVTTHSFGNIDAGSVSSGWEVRIHNDFYSTGSEDATSVKINVRSSCGETDLIWHEQHWVEVKSYGYSTGSTGMTDDNMSAFQPVGENSPLGIGDIASEGYRTLFVRVNAPTDAQENDEINLQLIATYQDPQTAITKWITGLRGNGIVASTGEPFEMSTGTTGAIPYKAGYALIDNNEIYYGSSGSFDCSTGNSGTNTIYLTESGAFGMTTGTSVDANQLKLYEAEINGSGDCTALTDKRVYLAGLQSGTTGAMPSTPDLTDVYFATNGKIFLAKTAGSWTMISGGNTFTGLSDTPSSYSTGDAKKLLRVTTGEDAIEFVTDFSDYADSAMIITGGEISVGTSGATFKVAALTAALREFTGATDRLIYKTLGEQNNIAITADNTSYSIILTYATGDPAISVSETPPNENNAISIGRVRKTTGGVVHFLSAGKRLQDGVGELDLRAVSLRFLELADGCTISYAGTNNMDVASGVVYAGINRFTPFSTGAFQSSGTDTFDYVGQSTGTTWYYTTGQSVIDYAHYDDGSTSLKNITVGQYGCHWVYLHPSEDEIFVVYGRDTYKLAEAEVAEEPNIPDLVNDFGLLLGCIIAPQAGSTFTTVQMVTDTFFTGTSVATHNSLGGLDLADYQHLTAVENAGLNAVEQTTSPTTGTVTIDWRDGRNFFYTRSTGSNGAVTFDFSYPPNISATLRLLVRGSTAGSTGAVGWSTGQTIYWEAGTPTFSSGAGFVNKINFYYSTGLGAYMAEASTGFGIL